MAEKPARSGRAALIRRAMSISVAEGSFATVHAALTGGAFFTGYALWLGADDAALGVLAAVPFLSQVFQLLSAYITERTGKVKGVTLAGGAGSRLLWVFPIALLFIPGLSASVRVTALILFFVVSFGLLFVSYNAWANWMADLIPTRLRGRYFGARNVAVIVVGLVITIAGGVALDRFKGAGFQGEGFAVLFGVGVVAAVASAVLIIKQPVPPAAPIVPGSFWARVRSPLADANFRRALLFFAVWHFSWALPLAFWNVHMLKYLKMSYFQIAVFGAILSLSSALGNQVWGKITDRSGNKPMLAISAVAVGVVPFLWLFPRPGAIGLMWFIAFWSGSSWAGFNLGVFTMPLALAPRAARNYYLAVFGIVTGAVTFAASTLGGGIAQALQSYEWRVGGAVFINYHFLFAVSGLGRFASVLFLRGVREPRAAGVRATISYVGDAVYDRLVAMMQVLPGLARRRRNHG